MRKVRAGQERNASLGDNSNAYKLNAVKPKGRHVSYRRPSKCLSKN